MFSDFTESELSWLVGIFNGVACTPETFIGNVIGALPFEPCPDEVDSTVVLTKLNFMSLEEIAKLHSTIERFWDTNGYRIPSVRGRMIEVGLL